MTREELIERVLESLGKARKPRTQKTLDAIRAGYRDARDSDQAWTISPKLGKGYARHSRKVLKHDRRATAKAQVQRALAYDKLHGSPRRSDRILGW